MNYIVSGLPRSGTSLVMQILESGGFPIAWDVGRSPDKHNPNGYFELFGGNIISKIERGEFKFEDYDDKAIKVTAYGIIHLPRGKYKIIYIQRDIHEVIMSMDQMSESPVNRYELESSLYKLEESTLDLMEKSDDIDMLVISHKYLLKYPGVEIDKISKFLGGIDKENAIKVVDPRLYRNRVVRKKLKLDDLELSGKDEEIIRKRLKELGYL